MVKKKVDVHFCRNTGTCSRLWHWLLHLTKATILINVTVSVTSHVLLSTQVCTSNMALWIVLRLTPSEATFFCYHSIWIYLSFNRKIVIFFSFQSLKLSTIVSKPNKAIFQFDSFSLIFFAQISFNILHRCTDDWICWWNIRYQEKN